MPRPQVNASPSPVSEADAVPDMDAFALPEVQVRCCSGSLLRKGQVRVPLLSAATVSLTRKKGAFHQTRDASWNQAGKSALPPKHDFQQFFCR